MQIDSKKTIKYMIMAQGNVSKAITLYIAENGCNGFRCKNGGCPLTLVCSHEPEKARDYAVLVMQKVHQAEKEALESSKKKTED